MKTDLRESINLFADDNGQLILDFSMKVEGTNHGPSFE